MGINNYLSDFQFVGSTVKDLFFKNDFISYAETDELERTIDVSYEVEDIIDSPEHEHLIMGILLLHVKVKIQGDNSSSQKKKNDLDLSITLEGCFHSNTLEEEKFKEMLEINGCATLYSIARSIIISITSQSFANGPCILPMINVYNMVDQQAEDEEESEK